MINNSQDVNDHIQYINSYTIYKEMFSIFNRPKKKKAKNKKK